MTFEINNYYANLQKGFSGLKRLITLYSMDAFLIELVLIITSIYKHRHQGHRRLYSMY